MYFQAVSPFVCFYITQITSAFINYSHYFFFSFCAFETGEIAFQFLRLFS